MLARVARAIWDKHTCDYCTTDAAHPLPPDCCCWSSARAAVEALREPSDAMLEGFDHKRRYAAIWSRMCDAILQETPE